LKKSRGQFHGFPTEASLRIPPSCDASLDPMRRPRKITGVCLPFRTTDVIVHRYEETIGGRAYQIEVTPVNDRWRAQIRRIPGMPTALMPFYGPTPDEAARQLSRWLALAHGRHAAQAGPTRTV
jgi:hypothetical protein